MAERKPLVVIDGVRQEIPAGDTIDPSVLPASSGGGPTGGGTDKVFYLNDQLVTANYTVPVGQNAMTAGPIELDDGVEVTISDGSEWTIV